MRHLASLYHLLRARATLVVASGVLLVLIAGVVATRFVVREDVTTLMPASPPHLAEQFFILREAPLLQGLTITVGGEDPARSAAILASALRGPEFFQVFAGAEAGFTPATLARICALSPGLMTEDGFAALPGLVTEEAIRVSLERNVRVLQSPGGFALRELLALDPLGICANTLRDLAPASGKDGPRLEAGRLVSADGKYAMILAEPVASVGDSKASVAVMERVRAAIRALPEGTEVLVAGGHRHTEANAGVIQGDMLRILPLSLGCLVLFFLVFIRTVRGVALFLLPTASLAVASACTGIVYGSLSGIVLGFGSVILGITADYAIHVFYAVRSGKDVGESLARVSRPLLLGALTTLGGFAGFFASAIPCIVQMTVFAICGVIAAVVLALVVLPLCLQPEGKAFSGPKTPCRTVHLSRRLVVLWGVTILTLSVLLYTVPVDGDVRKLSYTPATVATDEARTREIWGGLRDTAMFAVRAATREAALEKNAMLWRELVSLPAANGFDRAAITSLAPFLPPLSLQKERHARWKAFWRENGPETVTRLHRLLAKTDFSDEAFAPFADWVASSPEPIVAETLSGLGLPLPLLFLRQTATEAYVYSLVPTDKPSSMFLETLARHDAIYVSGQTFRDSLADATHDDLRRFGLWSLVMIVGMAGVALRSPRRMGIALFPVALGLMSVLAVFNLCGLSLNIFHAMALPLVMALSVDYGVFMLARLEGTLDPDSARGVLLSGLTSLSGFGALLLSRHPALFSLGLTVTLGLAASLVAALCLLPRLTFFPAETEKTDRGGSHA